MLAPFIPDMSSPPIIFEKEYVDISLFFADQLIKGKEVTQRLGFPGRVLDFALHGKFKIDGTSFPAGTWHITKCSSLERKITSSGISKGYFFSIGIAETLYKLFENGTEKKGTYSAPMSYSILKLISLLIDSDNHRNDEIWVQSYIFLLLTQLRQNSTKKSSLIFGELKTIYGIIERLNSYSKDFPTPASLVRESGIKIYRFQKGCLALYGQSAKKIIQHLKMKTAFDAIMIRKKSISAISIELGFRHTPNFITAFRKHFDITPAEASFYYTPLTS